MDASEQPRVVFEITTECADWGRAEEALRQALAQARGQGRVVKVRIEAAAPLAVAADAEITDENGTRVAHQVMPGVTANCAELAHNVGAWASGILQSEVIQPSPVPAPPIAAPSSPTAPPLPAAPSAPAPTPPPPNALPPNATSVPPNPPAPEKGDETAPLELGVGTFLMAGGGAGGYMGVAPFLIDDVGQAVFLRPSVAIGQSIATNLPSTWAAARLDTCMRLPGRYAIRGGLQLDLCGGADVGFSYIASGTQAGSPSTGQTLPYVDLGPSVDLRAEVGSFAVTLRGLVGVNVAREGFDDVAGTHVETPLMSGRLELDFSWVLYDARQEGFRKEALISPTSSSAR